MKVLTGLQDTSLTHRTAHSNPSPSTEQEAPPPTDTVQVSGNGPQPSDELDFSKHTFPPNCRFHWDEEKVKDIRSFRDGLALPALYRLSEEGYDKVPTDGTFIASGTHQHYHDAMLLTRAMGEKPFGSMSAAFMFQGPVGEMLADMGSFPVYRKNPINDEFPHPTEHAKEILNNGNNFCFYSEGAIYRDEHVRPLKMGIGNISMEAQVDYAQPVAQHYSSEKKFRAGEWAIGLGGTALVTGLAIAGAQSGNPWLMAGAGLLAGPTVGAIAGAGAGYATTEDKQNIADLGMRAFNGAKRGALAGGVAAAALGGAGLALKAAGFDWAPTILTVAAGVTGLAGAGLTYWFSMGRPTAYIHAAEPISTKPYKDAASASNHPDAERHQAARLTKAMHDSLKAEKLKITGNPSPYRMTSDGMAFKRTGQNQWIEVQQDKTDEYREYIPVEGSVFKMDDAGRVFMGDKEVRLSPDHEWVEDLSLQAEEYPADPWFEGTKP